MRVRIPSFQADPSMANAVISPLAWHGQLFLTRLPMYNSLKDTIQLYSLLSAEKAAQWTGGECLTHRSQPIFNLWNLAQRMSCTRPFPLRLCTWTDTHSVNCCMAARIKILDRQSESFIHSLNTYLPLLGARRCARCRNSSRTRQKSHFHRVYNEQNYSNNSTKSVRGATKSPETWTS